MFLYAIIVSMSRGNKEVTTNLTTSVAMPVELVTFVEYRYNNFYLSQMLFIIQSPFQN